MAGVAVLVYDGDCGFCTRSARWAMHRSRGMRVVPWQEADLAILGLTKEQCRTAVQVVNDGTVHSGGSAVVAALRECGAPYRALGTVLGARAMRPLVDRAYRVVARNRHRLPGSTSACALHGDEGALGGARRQGVRPAGAPADR